MRCDSPPESVGGAAAEGEVLEADVDEEREAVADLADQLAGDFLLARRGASSCRPSASSSPSGRRLYSSIVRSWKRDGGGVVAQPAAAALAALDLVDEVFEPAAQTRGEARGFFEGGVEAFVLEAE